MSEIQLNQDHPSSLFPNFMESEPLSDDSRMNDIVKEVLNAFPDACWGGSSVLHDVVLPPIQTTISSSPIDNSWNCRDIDIYCLDNNYNKIILFLKANLMVYFIRTISTIKKMSYANLEIKGLSEFSIKINDGDKRKLQLINLGKQLNYSNLINAIDLSFCSVVVSKKTIYYLRTTKTDVLEKRGTLLIKPCM